MKTQRPYPPEELRDWPGKFIPAPEVLAWIHDQLINVNGAIHNPAHAHLSEAKIGVLWTNIDNTRQMCKIAAQAEIPMAQGGKWKRARHDQQLEEWFGSVPDFLITLHSGHCESATDLEFAALIEHELFHCAQAIDEYGVPKFNRDTGKPKFAMKGHDIEEFLGVIERYGTGHPDSAASRLVMAAKQKPSVGLADISKACGTCILKIA